MVRPGDHVSIKGRKRLVHALAASTYQEPSVAGQVVAFLVVHHRVSEELVSLLDRAAALPRGSTSVCPMCLVDWPPGLCTVCADKLAGRPASWLPPVPPPTPTPRLDVEDIKAMCSGKRRYVSKIDADKVGKRCVYERGGFLRSYSCPLCGGWHLTHKREITT